MATTDYLNESDSSLAAGKDSSMHDSTEGNSSVAQTAVTTVEPTNSTIHSVDFSHTEPCTDCNPVTCVVNGEPVPGGTWRDLLVNIIEMFIATGNPKIDTLFSKPLLSGSSRPFLLNDKPNGAAKQITTGHWVYVNFNIATLVDIIGRLCRYCGVRLNDVEITYMPKSNRRVIKGTIVQNNIASSVFAQSEVREAFKAWLVEQHPDWSPNTLNMHYSDAYYLNNNDRGVTLTEALTGDNGIQKAYDAVLRHFEQNPTQIQPSVRASGYRRSLQMLKGFLSERFPELLTGNVAPVVTIPKSILDVLRTDYSNGFRLEATAFRLLSSRTGVEVDDVLQYELKRTLFRRSDDVYFLLDVVTAAEMRKDIIDFADALLDEYGCFEITELYALYADKLNPKCINGAEDFEKFYECICSRDVRCVAAPQIGNRIARYSNGHAWGIFDIIAQKIIVVTNDEFGGVISEEDLHKKFCAFSTDLLAKIIRNCVGSELLRVEINGIVCYQTLDALGLPDDFSDTLSDILYRLDDLGLTPNEEVLHTALSLALGVNFKEEYNIPDQATYRRLVDVYYEDSPTREWKYGIFGEVTS